MTVSPLIGIGGVVVGALTVLGTWLFNRKKAAIEESTVVLNAWKEFAAQHKEDMKRLRDEMDKDRTRYEAELDYLRARVTELEANVRDRDSEIAGLKRTISQISQSTAVQIGRVKRAHVSPAIRAEELDALQAIDRAGHNSKKPDAES